MASPRANPPRSTSVLDSNLPQQPSLEGGVNTNTQELGGRLVNPLAAGKERQPAVRKCRADCLSCPDTVRSKFVSSSITGRSYSTINISPHEISCKIGNYIYLLTCKNCNVQYVGESITPVNIRMNQHRTSTIGCSHMINHYENVCENASFFIQILEKLEGSGYINGEYDPASAERRLLREDYWIKTLRTVYPYGLNIRTKYMCQDKPVGKLFPFLPRFGERIKGRDNRRSSNSTKHESIDSLLDCLGKLPKQLRNNTFRKIMCGMKLKNHKKLAALATESAGTCSEKVKRWHDMIIDMFYTKIYKEDTNETNKKRPTFLIPIFFHNKGLDFIKLNTIVNLEETRNLFPIKLEKEDKISVVYSLGKTIRNQVFNYKDTVSSIDSGDTRAFGVGIESCQCHLHEEFVNKDHGHVLTGDLRFIENSKLRKLLSKGPNFREPMSINWAKCRNAIENGLDTCCDKISSSNPKVKTEDLRQWKTQVLTFTDDRIANLKKYVKSHKTNPILKQPDVVEYLNDLHSKYVLVPIDKAANNIAIICKKFYVSVILKEVGILGSGNDTYEKSEGNPEEIIHINLEFNKRLNLVNNVKDNCLPIMYWTPKLHKSPVGARFIIASKHCSTKPLSKTVSDVFKFIYKQVESFHTKAKFISNYNHFWVLQNADPVIENINIINRKKRAKTIATFDFSTLYTTLPHGKLIDRLTNVLDLVYKGGNKSILRVSNFGKVFWAKKKSKGSISFSKNSLKQVLEHLIENCYFKVGNILLRQRVGIPMGIDPAPFWANLFLYTYENEFVSNLVSNNKALARKFHSTKRFIDDLVALNDGGVFGDVFEDIYPPELALKMEHSGKHATFLSLDISIQDGIFVYKLFDKRDAFPFFIVRMPHLDSNIPESTFYSAMVGEFLRIARNSLFYKDFLLKAKLLIERMKSQGAKTSKCKSVLRKIISRHQEAFFGRFHGNILADLNV